MDQFLWNVHACQSRENWLELPINKVGESPSVSRLYLKRFQLPVDKEIQKPCLKAWRWSCVSLWPFPITPSYWFWTKATSGLEPYKYVMIFLMSFGFRSGRKPFDPDFLAYPPRIWKRSPTTMTFYSSGNGPVCKTKDELGLQLWCYPLRCTRSSSSISGKILIPH